MKIREGGVYILDEDYAQEHNFFFKKSTVVAISDKNTDGFFAGVQIGNFKNDKKSDKNRIIVETNLEGKKFFSVVSCEAVYMIPNSVVNKEIGTLDAITLKAIKYQVMINNEETEKGFVNEIDHKKLTEENRLSMEELLKILDSPKENFTITNQEELQSIESLLLDTNAMIAFVKNMIDDNDSKMRRIGKKICLVFSFLVSFFIGVFASYCANHWDNGITRMINYIYNFIDYIRDMF